MNNYEDWHKENSKAPKGLKSPFVLDVITGQTFKVITKEHGSFGMTFYKRCDAVPVLENGMYKIPFNFEYLDGQHKGKHCCLYDYSEVVILD